MPQLPSGLHVGTCISPILAAFKAGDFAMQMNFYMAVRSIEDIRYMVSLVYYHNFENGFPTDPYAPGYTLIDVDRRQVDWSEEDYEAFDAWQKLEPFENWLDSSYQEIQEAVSNMKVKLPESLHGILDGD